MDKSVAGPRDQLKIDHRFVLNAGRVETRIILLSAKILTLQVAEPGTDIPFSLAGFEEKAKKSEAVFKILQDFHLPQSEANAEMMVKEISKSGKDILEKITNKMPLSEKYLEFAKGVGEGLVVGSPALAAAMWKAGRRKAQSTREAALMLHAMYPRAQDVLDGAIAVYEEAAIGVSDKKIGEEKMSRLRKRPLEIRAKGLARGEVYLTLNMPDDIFGKYLNATTMEKITLMRRCPPESGEVRAAAMTPWEDIEAKSGLLAVKISTVVTAIRLAAAGAQGAKWLETVSKARSKQFLDWVSDVPKRNASSQSAPVSQINPSTSAQAPMPSQQIAAPFIPSLPAGLTGDPAFLSRLKAQRSSSIGGVPVQPIVKKSGPAGP